MMIVNIMMIIRLIIIDYYVINDDNDDRYGAAQAPVCKTVYEEECQTVQESLFCLKLSFKVSFLYQTFLSVYEEECQTVQESFLFSDTFFESFFLVFNFLVCLRR